jgi:cell division protein FtsB
MATRAQGRATQRAPGTPASRPERKPPDLKAAAAPAAARRSITDVGTLLALGMFAVCLALAALHAVLVENQASLDDLIEHNQQSRERIDQLQAEIAFLDSPEGLAEHARSVGLVPAADLVLLTPVGPGQLQPPAADPFSLGLSDYEPPAVVDVTGGADPIPVRAASASGKSAG